MMIGYSLRMFSLFACVAVSLFLFVKIMSIAPAVKRQGPPIKGSFPDSEPGSGDDTPDQALKYVKEEPVPDSTTFTAATTEEGTTLSSIGISETTAAVVNTTAAAKDEAAGTCDTSKNRMLIFVRHAKRLFRVVPWDRWIKNNFDKKGKYQPVDELYPKSLPERKGGVKMLERDPPLWGGGYKASVELGQKMKKLNISVDHVYSSLPLRCLETATAILEGLGTPRIVNMESGFHERAMNKDETWYMTPKELNANGFHVNESYKSFYPGFKAETILEVNKRIYTVVKKILERHEKEGGNIMIIGHANTGEMTTHLLSGLPVPSNDEYFRRVREACKVAYLSTTIFREGCSKDDWWSRVEPKGLPRKYDPQCMDRVIDPKGSLRILPNGTWDLMETTVID